MSTKKRVLTALEQSKGRSVSGQDLADQLQVSRTSIWKAIQSLKAEGYAIEATTNKGYLLSQHSDLLSVEAIRPLIIPEFQQVQIQTYKTANSTNTIAKQVAAEYPDKEFLLVSEEQTKGRGRLGRYFYSPSQTGIYMSLVLKPNLSIQNAALITTAAAVAVCMAIEKTIKKQPQIKWVNDLFLDGRKICGILTEAVSNFENGTIDTIIVGIGLNFKHPVSGFPSDIQDIAGSLLTDQDTSVTRNELIAEIANQFYTIYQTMEQRDYLDAYKSRCFVLGKNILFQNRGQQFEAIAIDIDQQGGLVVEMPDGLQQTLSYGEVSIKPPEQ